MAGTYHGVVKGVQSGDTLLIMGADASKGPPPEKLLSLAGIVAPRLGNRNGTPDAPYAWASREFLRQSAIGHRVSFTIESASPQNGAAPGAGLVRDFGSVLLDGTTSLAALILENGWAKLKPGTGDQQRPEYDELSRLAQLAQDQGRGLYGPETAAAVRTVKWAGTFDAAELIERCKVSSPSGALQSAPQSAVVEQVPSGSIVRVLLLPSCEQVTVIMAGIQAPAIRRKPDGTEEAEPFSREARFFVESRLLHRDVQVTLDKLDKNGAVVGTVLHPQGSMALELVKVGLARVIDWSCAYTGELAPQLRAAERAAKDKRLRIWRAYVPPNQGNDMGEFQGKVVEVATADTLVLSEGSGGERRLSLSSVRAPKVKEQPELAAEAKEVLRKNLIGKKVKAVPEYRRRFEMDKGETVERLFGSVFFNGEKNAAQLLIGEGLATVARHNQSDERSLHYDALLEAEAAAIAAKKGMHSDSRPPRASAIDLTDPKARERAKQFLSTLQRQGKPRATVQYVVNGARFKLLLPKDNLLIGFACVGLRCPACARRDGPGEPFGDEALAFTRAQCFQRDLEIEVEAVDKAGCFLGSLYLPDKRNLGVALLEMGLASRIPPAADRSTYGEALWKAEEAAKKESRKIWENALEEEAAAAKAEAAAAAAAAQEPVPDAQKQHVQMTLTEILDGAHFYAHVTADAKLASLQQQLGALALAKAVPHEPRAGQIVAAKFTQDDEWYRAKVQKKNGDEYTVLFIDYGNVDVVGADRLRALDAALGPAVISPQAIECRLACVSVGEGNDGGEGQEAVMALGKAAWGTPVLVRVEHRQGEVLHVTLFDAAQSSVSEQLIGAGLARVQKEVPKTLSLVASELREKEEAAKASRAGMWRYGDIDEDDAAEFGFRPAPPKPTGAWGKK